MRSDEVAVWAQTGAVACGCVAKCVKGLQDGRKGGKTHEEGNEAFICL